MEPRSIGQGQQRRRCRRCREKQEPTGEFVADCPSGLCRIVTKSVPEIFADAVPPAEASVLDLAYGRIRIHHDADVVRADDFLDKQVVDADIHIQVVEPPAVEIEAFRVTDVVLGAAEGFPRVAADR